MGADPGLAAAGDEQKANGALGRIESRAELDALAGEAQEPAHVACQAAISAAAASASSGDPPGSERRQRAGPDSLTSAAPASLARRAVRSGSWSTGVASSSRPRSSAEGA